jgi:hypothetical protein
MQHLSCGSTMAFQLFSFGSTASCLLSPESKVLIGGQHPSNVTVAVARRPMVGVGSGCYLAKPARECLKFLVKQKRRIFASYERRMIPSLSRDVASYMSGRVHSEPLGTRRCHERVPAQVERLIQHKVCSGNN